MNELQPAKAMACDRCEHCIGVCTGNGRGANRKFHCEAAGNKGLGSFLVVDQSPAWCPLKRTERLNEGRRNWTCWN